MKKGLIGSALLGLCFCFVCITISNAAYYDKIKSSVDIDALDKGYGYTDFARGKTKANRFKFNRSTTGSSGVKIGRYGSFSGLNSYDSSKDYLKGNVFGVDRYFGIAYSNGISTKLTSDKYQGGKNSDLFSVFGQSFGLGLSYGDQVYPLKRSKSIFFVEYGLNISFNSFKSDPKQQNTVGLDKSLTLVYPSVKFLYMPDFARFDISKDFRLQLYAFPEIGLGFGSYKNNLEFQSGNEKVSKTFMKPVYGLGFGAMMPLKPFWKLGKNPYFLKAEIKQLSMGGFATGKGKATDPTNETLKYSSMSFNVGLNFGF